MAKFPTNFWTQGVNAPSRIEVDIRDLEVEGEVPRDLDGAFYRVAADKQFPPLVDNDVPFNGDGTVSMFRFKNGRVDLKHRYVKTDKLKLEHAAGRALFGAYRNPFTDDPSVKGKNRTISNTNALVFGKNLYAMKEDGPPVAMDPETLETRGSWDFHGRLKTPFTAHPKVDRQTGQLIGFGYGAKGLMSRDVAYYEINAKGEITHEVWFEAPYYCMLHDFGVTRDYVIFPVIPVVGDVERLKAGAPHFGWDASKEIYLGVLPRGGEARDLRWFRAPNQFASHVMNAFNEGTKVHIDMPVAESNMFPFFPDITGKPWDPVRAASRLTRWTIDVASNSDGFESAKPLTDFVGEFPRNDDRYQSEPYRHGWLLGFMGPRNSLAHVDHATGKTEVWTADPDTPLQEPCFIPKSERAGEGEGYILQLGTRAKEMRTDVFLFDALRIAEGPITTIRLPLRLRPGYHGSWATAAQIDRAAAH